MRQLSTARFEKELLEVGGIAGIDSPLCKAS